MRKAAHLVISSTSPAVSSSEHNLGKLECRNALISLLGAIVRKFIQVAGADADALPLIKRIEGASPCESNARHFETSETKLDTQQGR